MRSSSDITIIGAGPYGLSIAAHLRRRGLDFRIVGSPMRSWTTNMPKGMLLKSAGFASTLYAPGGDFSLKEYCARRGLPYEDLDLPVPVETFSDYGTAFQQRFAPDLLDRQLVSLQRCPKGEGFELDLDDGTSFRTARVILAVGLDYFRSVPEVIEALPKGLWSHSADHHELAAFRSKEVAVLGGGSSASDLAILLHEAGARVQLVARKPSLEFGEPWSGPTRTVWGRIRLPMTGLGPGWKNVLCTKAPMFYRYLPDDRRVRYAKSILGPSGGWFMKERAAPVPTLLGHRVLDATARNGKASLGLAAPDGAKRELSVDHVVAATGYRADVYRLPFLGRDIIENLRLIARAPRLSPDFESSVPGLYFVGPVAAASFGPVMRFAVGADFTSRHIVNHLAAAHEAGSSPEAVDAHITALRPTSARERHPGTMQ